jgi:hypothetical protein
MNNASRHEGGPNVPEQTARHERSFGNRMMWVAILWCLGFGVTFLVALPFHLLVMMAMRH